MTRQGAIILAIAEACNLCRSIAEETEVEGMLAANVLTLRALHELEKAMLEASEKDDA